ncbi:hypothetical protein B0H10DRAFT_1839944, partial [Mycena sp. CBHHK59/15]
ADIWYKGLTAAVKADWDQTEAAFAVRWPETLVVQKAQTDYEFELSETKLLEKDLGKKETVLGREIWTHVIWADKMAKLAAGAKVNTGTMYIAHTRRGLPDIIKDKLVVNFVNWDAFLKAVRDVDIEHIRDGAEKLKKEQEKQKAVDDRIAQLTESLRRQQQLQASPTAGIRQQMMGASLQGPGPRPGPIPFSLGPAAFGGRGAGRGGFVGGAGGPLRAPATETQKAALRDRIKAMPQHPNTAAGCLEHQKQQQQWVATHGIGAKVTEFTPYPLRPGTLPVNSGECWQCGVDRHLRAACTVPDARRLHPNESAWRSICRTILREPPAYAQQGPTNVRLVQIDDYGTWEEITDTSGAGADGEQGNGLGLSE